MQLYVLYIWGGNVRGKYPRGEMSGGKCQGGNVRGKCPDTHMLFFTFYALLCALANKYTIYFFLIHHCTNSLSSLHILVHHCTLRASLHTKTSPAFHSSLEYSS